ncbi:GntR family transcriptional regulator [Geminisphaera colitermitum]|uniref:GntR family transcriptional regulator n=1 Tax=Geminisphaera colitermitum TaxID=1148786 RepID=UPI000158C552|nr:GntR family transcriptional regulator [Geminisphaera colitermitum]
MPKTLKNTSSPPPSSRRAASARASSRSLSRQAYDHLANLLLTDLSPGDILNRRQVAADLNISVAPVLEAMVQLEADGLLETLPRKGTRVRSARAEDLRGQLILREAIECEAARLYCGAPVRQNAAALETLATRIDQIPAADNLALWRAETAFHRALVVLADCDVLTDAFDRVMRQSLFIAMKFFLEAHPEKTRGNHRKLVRQLKTATPDKAQTIMREHLRYAKPAALLPPR